MISARFLLAIPLCLAACTTQEPPAAPSPAPLAPGAPGAVTPVTAPEPAPAPAPDAFPALRSQDEADAAARAAISKQNADAELEKLKQELSGGK